MTAIQNLARAANDAYDLLDATIMDVECDDLTPDEHGAFDAACDVRNRLELICATFDEMGTLPSVSTREGA